MRATIPLRAVCDGVPITMSVSPLQRARSTAMPLQRQNSVVPFSRLSFRRRSTRAVQPLRMQRAREALHRRARESSAGRATAGRPFS